MCENAGGQKFCYNAAMTERIEKLSEAQRNALEEMGVVLLYLHGSVASLRARSDSDVDVAVLFDHAPDDTVRATTNIVEALQGYEKLREMDVAILNDASPLLKQGVAAHGELLFARSERDDLEFQIRTMHEYEASRRIVRIGQEAVLARIV